MNLDRSKESLLDFIDPQRYFLLPNTAGCYTADEAIRALEALIAQRLANGARIVFITVPDEHPWSRLAGMFEDDPLFDKWQKAIADRRREMDNDPDVP